MGVATPCPKCETTLNVPDGAAGKRIKCRECSWVLRIKEAGAGYELLPMSAPADAPGPEAAAGPEEPAVHVSCPGCGADIAPGQGFCTSCGVKLSDETKEQVQRETQKQKHIVAGRERRKHRRQRHRERKVASAAKWVLAISILFAVFGTFFGIQTAREAETARQKLAGESPDTEFQVDGRVWTVQELRETIDREVVLVFTINYVLALTMLGMFFWAKKSPVPALVTALCIYLAVIAVSGIYDPATLVKGVALKILCIVGLVGGIRAALAERAVQEDGDEPGVRRRPARA